MNNDMTPQEAISQIISIIESIKPHKRSSDNVLMRDLQSLEMAISALQEQIPMVITVEEAKTLSDHTPVWLEYRIKSMSKPGWKSSCWLHYAKDAYRRGRLRNKIMDDQYKPAARIWVGVWPWLELRESTPWKGEKDNG